MVAFERVLAPRTIAAVITVSLLYSSIGCSHTSIETSNNTAVRRAATGAEIGAIIVPHFQQQDEILKTQQGLGSKNKQMLADNDRLIAQLRQRGIDVRDSDRGVIVNLPDVLFKTGTAQLTASARETVSEIAQILKRAPSRSLLVEGHTDSQGNIQHNYTLSLARAQEVASALSADGIPSSKISTRGYGETTPITSNATEQGRRRNRRVEVIIL